VIANGGCSGRGYPVLVLGASDFLPEPARNDAGEEPASLPLARKFAANVGDVEAAEQRREPFSPRRAQTVPRGRWFGLVSALHRRRTSGMRVAVAAIG